MGAKINKCTIYGKNYSIEGGKNIPVMKGLLAEATAIIYLVTTREQHFCIRT